MNRRLFLHQGGLRAAWSFLGGAAACRALGATTQDDPRRAAAAADGTSLPRPTPAQIAWQECEVGLLYSFDLAVAAGVFARNNTVRERLDPGRYNPAKLDTDQWLEAAKAAGAGYAVFTATHFNGFMQWQSDLYPYGLKQAKWRGGKGDVVGDFVESCRKAGVKPGLYFSTHRNVYWEVWGHYVAWGKGRGTDAQARFNRVAEKMTEELCSRYGPLVQIWFDAGVKTPSEGGPDVLPIFEKHQPDSVFYHSRQRSDIRWIGNEQGHAGVPCWATMPIDQGEVSHNARGWRRYLHGGLADGKYWSPGMVDVPLRGSRGVHNWFWAPNQDHAADSTEKLVKMYGRAGPRERYRASGGIRPGDPPPLRRSARRNSRRGRRVGTAVVPAAEDRPSRAHGRHRPRAARPRVSSPRAGRRRHLDETGRRAIDRTQVDSPVRPGRSREAEAGRFAICRQAEDPPVCGLRLNRMMDGPRVSRAGRVRDKRRILDHVAQRRRSATD